MKVCLHVQSCKLVHVSGIHCHGCASSTSCCLLWALLQSTVQIIVIQYLYFKPRISGSKHKSSSDVVGIAQKHQLLYCPIVLFKALYCKMNYFCAFSVYSHLCLFFMYSHFCVKSIIKLLQYSVIQHYIVNCICRVPRLGMAAHSNILAWRIPWTEEAGRL